MLWMRACRSLVFPAVAASIICSCGGDTTAPPTPASARVIVVSGGNVSDTVRTLVGTPLTVEVRDSLDRPVPDAAVHFKSIAVASVLYPVPRADVYPVGPGEFRFDTTLVDTTDSRGRASVRLRLGVTAGAAPLAILVPSLAVIDTLTVRVLPGNAVRVAVVPRDTGLVAGKSIQLRGTVVDAAGNARQGSVSFSAVQTPAGAVTSQGLVSGKAIGQVSIVATSGGIVGDASVEIVPDAVIAAYRPSLTPGTPAAIATMKLDGSQYRELTPVTGSAHDVGEPVWTETGSIIFGSVDSHSLSRLQIMSAEGVVAPLNVSGTPNADDERWPSYNAVAHRIFYTARMSGGPLRVWARMADGTLADVRIESDTSPSSQPSASPDGTRLAYVGGATYDPYVGAISVNAPAVVAWRVRGERPSWSPRGDVIAYLSSQYGSPIRLVAADGAYTRTLTAGIYPDVPIAWSPDAAWIVARNTSGIINLVSAASGTEIPLTYLNRFWNISWKP